MARIIKHRRNWGNVKPPLGAQIDWGHPLAKNIHHVLLCNEMSGQPRELATGEMPTTPVGSGRARWSITPSGTAVQQVSGEYLTFSQNNGASLQIQGAAWTYMVKYRTDGNENGVNPAALSAQGAGQLNIRLGHTVGAPPVKHRYIVGEVGSEEILIGSDHAGGKSWTLAGTTGPLNNHRLYENGMLIASNSNTISFTHTGPGATGPLVIFCASNSDLLYVEYFYLWNRALLHDEILWLYHEPYAFIQAPSQHQYFFQGEAGGGILYDRSLSDYIPILDPLCSDDVVF